MKNILLSVLLLATTLLSSPCFGQIPILDRYESPIPEVVSPGSLSEDGGVAAPSDAISLFNGNDMSEWTSVDGPAKWTVHDGMFTIPEGGGDIFTKREFGDFQLHIEFYEFKRKPPA